MLIFKNSGLCVPSISNIYVSATLLSIWIWIVKFEKFFVKVRIVNLTAISFKTFMWYPCPFIDHFLLVEIPLQWAPTIFWKNLFGLSSEAPTVEFFCHWLALYFLPTKEVLFWLSSQDTLGNSPGFPDLIFAPVGGNKIDFPWQYSLDRWRK